MIFNVTQENNFCRVLVIPALKKVKLEYCFGGANPHPCGIVDWFNPSPKLGFLNEEELKKEIQPFIQQKHYYNKKDIFIVVCEFGLTFQV